MKILYQAAKFGWIKVTILSHPITKLSIKLLNKSCCEKKEEIFVSTQRICNDVWYKIPLILMTSQNAIFTCNLLLSWCDIKQSYYNQVFNAFVYSYSKFFKMILNQSTKNETELMSKYTHLVGKRPSLWRRVFSPVQNDDSCVPMK